MSLFDLAAKVTLDTKGYEKGVAEATSKGKALAKHIGGGLATAAKVGAAGIAAVGTAAAGIGTFAVKAGMAFESQMSKVGAISGATGEDMEALTAKAKQLGIDTKFSATEAGQAFEYMAMAGWKTEDMLDGVSGIMDLAAASGEDLGMVSDIVTDAMTAFGLSADKSAHFADVLAAASSNSNTNVGMMGETFKYVAPVAGSLGFSIEDTAVAIGLMANAGIKSSQAGTSLRSMMSRLVKPTKEVNEAFQALGYTEEEASHILVDSSGNTKEFSAVVEDLRTRFAGLSETEKAETAAKLAGQEAMSGLLAIVNASSSDYDKLTAAINGADGASKQMADTMANNLQGKITLLKSSAEGFGLAVYEKMQEPLTNLASAAIDNLNTLTEEFNTNGVEGVLGAIANMMGKGLEYIIGKLPEILEVGGRLVKNMISGMIERLPDITKMAVELIVTLATGLVEHIPDLLLAIPKIIEAIVKGFASADVEWLEVGKNIVRGLWKGITSLGSWIGGKVKGFFGGIVDKAKGVLGINSPSKVFAGIGGYMAEGLENGWDEEYANAEKKITSGLKFKTSDAKLRYSDSHTQPGIQPGSPFSEFSRPLKIVVQSVLDGRVIGETAYNYSKERSRAYGY